MSALKLYHASGSPNARRVRIFIAEKKLDIELVAVDLGTQQQFSDSYRAINPRSMVPALVLEDGTAISEVPAIWRYLEERYPAPALLGTTPEEKALVAMWERRAELDGFIPVMEAVRNSVPGLKGRALAGPHAYEQIPALAERSKARVAHFFADLDLRLADVAFVAGASFSVADITALAAVDFATRALNHAIGHSQHNLLRWYDAVCARPSATA